MGHLSFAMADGGNNGVRGREGPQHFLNQDYSKAMYIVQVYLQASLLLFEHSF